MEGVAEDGISRLLVFAKGNHGISEHALNKAIALFRKQADPLEKHNCLPLGNFKFNPKVNAFSFTGTAAQTRTLLWRFSFILNLVDGFSNKHSFFQSQHFKCFSLLVKISSFVYSPCIFSFDVHDLKLLIHKYLEMTVQLYSPHNSRNATKSQIRVIKPKGHHMIHYPKLTFQSGPLRHSSTLCHERSMGKYKGAVHSKLNPTIQIAMSMRFQMLHYVNEQFDCPSRIKNTLCDMSRYHFPNVQLPAKAIVHKTLRTQSMLLAQGLAILRDVPSPLWLTRASPPSFYRILLVYSLAGSVNIVIKSLQVIEFSRQFMAYKVVESDVYENLNIKNLYLHKSFSVHEHNDSLYLFPDSLPYKEY